MFSTCSTPWQHEPLNPPPSSNFSSKPWPPYIIRCCMTAAHPGKLQHASPVHAAHLRSNRQTLPPTLPPSLPPTHLPTHPPSLTHTHPPTLRTRSARAGLASASALLPSASACAASASAKRLSRQPLQKLWPQGMDSGCCSTPLHSEQLKSRSRRSCADAWEQQQDGWGWGWDG